MIQGDIPIEFKYNIYTMSYEDRQNVVKFVRDYSEPTKLILVVHGGSPFGYNLEVFITQHKHLTMIERFIQSRTSSSRVILNLSDHYIDAIDVVKRAGYKVSMSPTGEMIITK